MEVNSEMVGSNTNVVPGKPPKLPFPRNVKRHSLQSGETLTRFNKLTRHSSQPRLRKDEISGSLTNLHLDSSRKSSSLAQLNMQSLASSGKALSASNLAAISDSNLSIKEAVPLRSYDQPNSSYSAVKRHFEFMVKRYFLQLTEGCGYERCCNRFCCSGGMGSKFSPQLAAIVSIELASRNQKYFCVEETCKSLPENLFDGEPDVPRPFLHCLFSTTPFQSLFETNLMSNLSRCGSYSSLRGSQSSLTRVSKEKSLSRSSLRLMSNPDLLSNQLKELSERQHDGKVLKNSEPNYCLKSDSKSPLPSHPLNLDIEFSKSNLSGNLVSEVELPDLSWDFHGSNSSLNELVPLEEFEKECALEMSSGYIQEFSLTHLTLKMLESSIENYKGCHDPSFLLNTIRTVFTSVEALNESFRKETIVDSDGPWNELDIAAVRKAYNLLLSLEPRETFVTPLLNATEIHLVTLESFIVTPEEVYQLAILIENSLLHQSQDLLRKLCSVLNKLPQETRHALVIIFSRYSIDAFQNLVQVFHDFLGRHVHPNQCTEPHLIEICKVMSIFYDAYKMSTNQATEVHDISPVSLFYSDDLSKKLDFKKEYESWRIVNGLDASENDISVLDFPFLFDPTSKVRVMHIDAVWQMRVEYQNAIVHQARVQQAQRVFEETDRSNRLGDVVKSATCPFLVLSIRRDHIIRDTLNQINLKEGDLKKPLKIKYVGGGEQGLDMGGLQREFFHMIVDSIFESDFGMFTYLEETRLMWINGSSLESEMEFELVGIILGLAIYNGVILDVHFPSVIYKKLQGCNPNLQDLIGVQPSLARSLRELLEFEGDVDDIFCYTYQISHVYYGKVANVDLVPNGSEISVTNANRTKFVNLYVKYLLVDSVAKQFDAFARGFHKVCGGATLTLFSPEELELLICGCPVSDFSDLEVAATYEDGYSPQHPTIRMLWHVFNDMNVQQKKAVLMFVTGSDRVPLKGLSNLTFIIQKHGPDSDRLPAALTCFNRLLLPSYEDQEKLRERLIVAIENSKGFGLT